MKKFKFVSVLLFVVFVLVLFTESSAQNPKYIIGFEGGPGIISLRGNDIVDSNTKSGVGFLGGIYGEYYFNNSVGLKLAFNYQQKGTDIDYSYNVLGLGESKVTGYQKYNYLTIPLLLKAKFGEKVKFFVNGGPYLGILLNDKQSVTVTPPDPNEPVISSNDANNKSTDFGITMGLGAIIPLSNQWALTFEVRDDLGLTNISKDPVVNDGSLKTNAASFIVGFSYSVFK